ncbi:MAG TPA: alpha/beta hydrolase [Flavitalea sp.]|nr:alpha/beta hydrolase [Flavitalea sp.]
MKKLLLLPVYLCRPISGFSDKLKKLLLLQSGLLIGLLVFGQQEIIRLYPGKAPGSEAWDWKEELRQDGDDPQSSRVYNVVDPSLTVFRPNGDARSRTAIIIAPGGGFLRLAFEKEGTEVAEWLAKKGVTAFVLKYRLNHTTEGRSSVGQAERYGKVVELAMQDGLEAVAYVRRNAEKYHIAPDRIGFMGFSAGGTVTMSVAMSSKEVNRPDFIIPVYPYFAAAIGHKAPTEKMPAFICVASDDGLRLVPQSIDIYNKWIAAGQAAELHIYEKGGHGFGMSKQGIPTDSWIERAGEWLKGRGLLEPGIAK